MFIKVPLEKIQDNPFQTRSEYNDIEALATSIVKMKATRPETSGLVQVPPARLWDIEANAPLVVDNLTRTEIAAMLNNGAVVQLAAGHRRLRAFQFLARRDPDYGTFPVDLNFYTDEAMADLVWSENHDRADLSAIEEAEGLQRDMQAFNWTQQHIATRRGLSRPAVANKLRLLNLPNDAQAAIRSGKLTERHGRVLLKAQSLTPEIYQLIANELISIPVADEIAEKARQLKTDDQHIIGIYGHQEPCALCSTPTKKCLDDVQTRIYLCEACMRVATGWEPPSVAEADAILKRLINSHAQRIYFFPLDQEIGGKAPCTGCPMLDQSGRSPQCIDGACHEFKTEAWRAILIERLQGRFVARWPEDYINLKVNFDGYHGYEMDEQDDMDRHLAAHVCSPACPHFSMRYYPHEYCHYIKLAADMPFIAVCFSTNSHNACVRRLTKDGAPELAKYNAELAESERRKRQGVELLRRAQIALAEAIKAGQPGVFEALSHSMGQKAKDPYLTIAHWMTNHEYCTFNPDQTSEWTEKNADRYKRGVMKQLGEWGIALPSSADELIERLEKIARFIEEHRSDMTPEQITGNVANCEKLAEEIGEAFTLKLLTEADYQRMYMHAVELRNRLVKIDNSRLVNVLASTEANVSQETI
jgi:ParB/RepB/Spo0J family partition protein